MINNNLIVLSEKYNCFVWLVARTGSNHMVSILKNFDFKIYDCMGKNKKLYDNELKSIHTYNLFEGSETYKFLISVRNPYAREVSSFRMNKYVENPKESFKDFLENNRVYKELVQIKNFTFDDFISRLKEQEERLDKLIEHIAGHVV